MKRLNLIVVSIVVCLSCSSQDKYHQRLGEVITEIRQLTEFDNGMVTCTDSSGYGSMYPYWTVSREFYKDDIVAFQRGTAYRALIDNSGKNPATSPNEWLMVHGSHPYLFLRDSARLEDLMELVKSDHAYIRVYSFAALVHRKAGNLYQMVVNNLGDTTKIEQFTSDYGYTVYPADLMLWYTAADFSTAQKDALKEMMLTKHSHLTSLEEILLFLKPTPERYPYVRQIAIKGAFGDAALIALARYKKPEDIELIRTGFKETGYYSGHKIFFIAIESFPDDAFKNDLISSKREIMMNYDMSGYKYYFKALAAYRDQDCVKVFEELVNQPHDENVHRSSENRIGNLMLMLNALKGSDNKMYRHLINKIEGEISKGTPSETYYDDELKSVWDY